MLSNAIEKIRSEMTKNASNSYIQVVGEFLLQHLENSPRDAEKVLIADKTIGNSLVEMRKAAEKKKAGNCAMFTPQEGFEIVLKYFGIEAVSVAAPKPAQTEVKPKPIADDDFDIKLEDLL